MEGDEDGVRADAVVEAGEEGGLPSARGESDHVARGDAEGSLVWAPKEMPPPVGYICALKDPDGNMIEFSFDQGVYAKAQEVWG